MQASNSAFPDAGVDLVGDRFAFLDYNISRVFTLGDRDVSVKLGNQVLNWGESALLFLNSLNTINAPDATRARVPGFDLKEAFQPQGMIVAGTDLIENVSLEAFYQYQWRPIVVDPVGSFFSVSDTLGAGGRYAMLSFAKAPEDPLQLYEPFRNPDDPTAVLGSRSSRTLLRDYRAESDRGPSNGGQYGASIKTFLQDLNNGTEIAFYFANYHAHIPSVSGFASQASCIPAPTA